MRRPALLTALTAFSLVVSSLVPAAALDTATPAHPGPGVAAAAEETTGRLIVKYNDSPSDTAQDRLLDRAAAAAGVPEGDDVARTEATAVGATVVELAKPVHREEAQRLADELAADPAVAYAVPDQILTGHDLAPADPGYPLQWSMTPPSMSGAWTHATGKGSVIGIIDSGVTVHPDLEPQLVGGYDFIADAAYSNDGEHNAENDRDGDHYDSGTYGSAGQCGGAAAPSTWHGTHVAGIAAADDNGYGTVGVAPDAELFSVRALGACDQGSLVDIGEAISWMSGGPGLWDPRSPAERTADVINLSLGMEGPCNAWLQENIDHATARGITVVTSAGNSGVDAARSAPGNCHNVVNVGAVTKHGSRASFSNYGTAVDVYAPGQEILSSWNDGTQRPGSATVGTMSGTSMAAPYVAGVVALLKEQDRSMTPAEIEAQLKRSADSVNGLRVVDPAAAVSSATPPSPFTDISRGQQFYEEMVWIAERGISTGWTEADGSRTYRALSPVNRDAMAAFLYRFAGSPAYTAPPVSPFQDVSTGQQFYKEMAWLAEEGISTGWIHPDGTRSYRPLTWIKRDAMAAFLRRLDTRI
jgi:serine protease